MQIFVYRKGGTELEEGFSREELPALLADSTNVVWVDLRGETEAHLAEAKEVLTNVFAFHYLTIEDCVELRNQPKIESFPDYLFFIVHGVKPEETRPTNFVTKELDGYLGPNYVVTFHRERFRSIKDVKKQLRVNPFAMQRGSAYLLHQILDNLVDLYMPLIDEFDRVINTLEVRVLDTTRNDNAMLGEIMNVRRAVARQKRISSRQLQVLYRISHGEFPHIPEPMLPYFRDVHDHLLRITDLAEGYRDLVGGLFDIHFAVVGSRTNDVMKTLAVVSAIILPLGLIAGIYGMNFVDMPGLKTPLGFWLTVALMLLITAGLLVYFWRRGWIFQKEAKILITSPVAASNPDDDYE
ncbi:MAG: magnesium/cobalt transporter CorA [Pyrinomonadaceae bacterium]